MFRVHTKMFRIILYARLSILISRSKCRSIKSPPHDERIDHPIDGGDFGFGGTLIERVGTVEPRLGGGE